MDQFEYPVFRRKFYPGGILNLYISHPLIFGGKLTHLVSKLEPCPKAEGKTYYFFSRFQAI